MKKAVCFGEIMLRLNPKGYFRLLQGGELETSFAGGEANVAVSLAQYGVNALFVSKVPEHDIGQCAINAIRRYGVDTRFVLRGGQRLGLYFVEKGASQRASKVIYDRSNSAVAEAAAEEYDWDTILDKADWFHFTGITPALSDNAAEACLQAVTAAKKQGITVSCDLNYRKKLWSREKAGQVMAGLMRHVDVCIANEEDAADVFGINAGNSDIQSGSLDKDGYLAAAKTIQKRFGCKKVAITLRGSISASDNTWSGMLYDGDAYFAPEYKVHIVDRVGGGDSFGGGLIYALMHGYDGKKAIDFAVAASCLKHTIEQDFNLVSVAEVAALADGNASGRVQR
jgi:2-dehydro-3-deoxygluconokinase